MPKQYSPRADFGEFELIAAAENRRERHVRGHRGKALPVVAEGGRFAPVDEPRAGEREHEKGAEKYQCRRIAARDDMASRP